MWKKVNADQILNKRTETAKKKTRQKISAQPKSSTKLMSLGVTKKKIVDENRKKEKIRSRKQ